MNESSFESFICGLILLSGRREFTYKEIVNYMGKFHQKYPNHHIDMVCAITLGAFIEDDGMVLKLKDSFSLNTILMYPLSAKTDFTLEKLLYHRISRDLYNQLHCLIKETKPEEIDDISPSPYDQKFEELFDGKDSKKEDGKSRGVKVYYFQ